MTRPHRYRDGRKLIFLPFLVFSANNERATVIGDRALSRHDAAAAVTLARDVASLVDHPMDDVWWALCNVSVDMRILLDTAQGWSELPAYLSDDMGLGSADYLPSVH